MCLLSLHSVKFQTLLHSSWSASIIVSKSANGTETLASIKTGICTTTTKPAITMAVPGQRQWMGRDFGDPLHILEPPQPYEALANRDLEIIAKHWTNRRFTLKKADISFGDLPGVPFPIDFSEWTDTTGKTYGYEVTIAGSPPLKLHPQDPSQLDLSWMIVRSDDFPAHVTCDESKHVTLQLYYYLNGGHDFYLVQDEDISVLQPKTTWSACDLYMGLYIGTHDSSRRTPPRLTASTSRNLHHWATIHDDGYHRVRTQPLDSEVMVQHRVVTATAHIDIPIYGVVSSGYNHDSKLSWYVKESSSLPTEPPLLQGDRRQYELYLYDKNFSKRNRNVMKTRKNENQEHEGDDEEEDDEEEDDVIILLHDVAANEWYRVHEQAQSTVSHVRQELSITNHRSIGGCWDSVRTAFDHVSILLIHHPYSIIYDLLAQGWILM
jgi:hypothetical protein